MQWYGCRCSSDEGHAAQQALEAAGRSRLKGSHCVVPWWARDFVPHPCVGERVAPQLKRDPLGRCPQANCATSP